MNIYRFKVGYRVENDVVNIVAENEEKAESRLRQELESRLYSGSVESMWVSESTSTPSPSRIAS